MTFGQIAIRLPASRDTLSATLTELVANGIVRRGGPGRLRIYELTPDGEVLGGACLRAVEAVRATGTVQVAVKKWPMFVLVAMGGGAARFGELCGALPGVTPRALAMALRDLEAEGLVRREVTHDLPPGTTYRLAERARTTLLPAMEGLVWACDQLGTGGRSGVGRRTHRGHDSL